MFPQRGWQPHTHKMDMDPRCTKEVEWIGLESDKLGMEDREGRKGEWSAVWQPNKHS